MLKKPSRRQFLKLSAATSAALLLTACAPTDPEREGHAGNQTASNQPASNHAEEQEVIVWFKDVRTINEMTEEMLAVDLKEEYPHIDAKLQFVPTRQGLANLQSSHAAGQAPDIFFPARGFIQAILQLGVAHPMPEGLMDVRAEMGNRVADFYRLLDGNYYMLPTGQLPNCLYYNADLLEQHGYGPEDIPTTWDDFIPWASSLTQWDGDTLVEAGFSFTGDDLWLVDTVRFQNGGWWFTDDKTCAWSQPESADAYQFVLELFETERLQDKFGLSSLEQFAQNQSVTSFARTARHGLLHSQFPDLNWGTLPMPTATGEGPFGSVLDETGFVVTTQKSEDGAHFDATWALWRYLAGPAYQRRYSSLRGVHPAQRSLWTEAEFTTENEAWRGITISTQPGNYRTPGIWPGEVTAALIRSWTRVRDEGESIEVALQDACTQVETLLARQESWPLIIGQKRWETNLDWENES